MTEEHQDLLFDLTLDEDQQLTRETLRRFAQSEMQDIAKIADESAAPPEGFYEKTAGLGFTMMPVPEVLGGAGMPRSPVSNVLIAEDLAAGDMALAMGAMSPLSFVNTVLDNGSEEQISRFLSRFTDGQFHAAGIALMEPRATFDPMQLETTAKPVGDAYVINGTKCFVPLGEASELILVIARIEEEGPGAFVVSADTPGISRQPEAGMGLKALPLSRLVFEDVQVGREDRLGASGGAFDLQRMVDLGRIGLCAMSLGVCRSVLDYVIEYCNERVAFGEPITHRQSVAFMIGDMATELEAMRLMVWRAAARAGEGLSFHKEACLMHIQCAKQAMQIGTNGVQLLGGHGFVREHPVERWYRNLRATGIVEGCVIV